MNKYSDPEILDTILNDYSENYILQRFIDSIDSSGYRVIGKLINYKKKYDILWMNQLNDKIKDTFNIDVIQLYNLDDDSLENSMKIFIDVLNSLHFDFVKVLMDFSRINEIHYTQLLVDKIPSIVKQTRGKLRSLLSNLEVSDIEMIIYQLVEIYPVILSGMNIDF